ncbi:MAG: UPF0147 family protein [Candidatus Nanohaloarchaea archaeon]|nr:UPF0147 family protein [Candidatus Nanohaloarchaea archaeon]
MTKIEAAIQRMEDLKEDEKVPSNVKDRLDECIDTLQDDDEDLSVRVNTAASVLDEVSNDPNIEQHTRTEIWNIASMVESLDNE